MGASDDWALEDPVEQPPLPLPPSPEELIAATKARGELAAHAFGVQKARAAIHRILGASDAEIRDRAFILGCIQQVGLSYQDWLGLAPFTRYTNATSYGLLQIPTEFADYLLLAGASRPREAIEIGVFRGASAYVSAAYFYRLNKEHSYVAVDVVDGLVDFDYFKDVLPLIKAAPSTSGEYAGRSFDLALIDGDHSYDGSRIDWLNVGQSSSLVAFHDINASEYDGLNGGIRRTWNELKLEYRQSCPILEISHYPGWMGIGVIFNRRPVWL